MSARKPRCSACGGRARRLQRAFVLTPGSAKPGRVCPGCARLGWLLVLGGEDKPRRTPQRAVDTMLAGELARLEAVTGAARKHGLIP